MLHVTGDIRSGPSMSTGELQSLIKDGSLLTVSRMNREGGWEKVVAVENDLTRKGGGGGGSGVGRAGYKSEDDQLNWSKQSQSALVDEEV